MPPREAPSNRRELLKNLMLRLRIKQLIDNSLFGVIPGNIITTVDRAALETFFANMIYTRHKVVAVEFPYLMYLILSDPIPANDYL